MPLLKYSTVVKIIYKTKREQLYSLLMCEYLGYNSREHHFASVILGSITL